MFAQFHWVICSVIGLLFLHNAKISLASSHVRNCSLISHGTGPEKGTSNLINCSMDGNDCGNISYDCTNCQPPNIPKHKPSVNDWYLYTDPSDNSSKKIALNFTWGFTQDNTLESVHGFWIVIENKRFSLRKELHYCLESKLYFYKHVFALFNYDKYGKTNQTQVSPGTNFTIHVYSMPCGLPNCSARYSLPKNHLSFDISIPKCGYDDKFHNVDECVTLRQLVKVEKLFCENRTVHIQYNIPPSYRNTTTVVSSAGLESSDSYFYKNSGPSQLPGTSSLYLHIDDDLFTLNKTYSISVFGPDGQHVQKLFSFQNCPKQNPVLLYLLTASGVLFGVCILFLILFILRKWSDIVQAREKFRDVNSGDGLITSEASFHSFSAEETAQKKTRKCVYLIFVQDHPMHTDAVEKFAKYLQKDLGFIVFFHLWERQESAKSLCWWMENSMKKADKIVVIWSPGATRYWNQYNNTNGTPTSDDFTPVLKRIHTDLFSGKNVGKYFFARFSYCNESLPDQFKQLTKRTFTLMEQFNELYFLLKDEERFIPGGFSHINEVEIGSYSDPQVNEVGPLLKQAIADMNDYVKDNPDWHSSTATTCTGGSEFYCAPFDAIDEIQCSREVLPPPELSDDDVEADSFSLEPASLEKQINPPVYLNDRENEILRQINDLPVITAALSDPESIPLHCECLLASAAPEETTQEWCAPGNLDVVEMREDGHGSPTGVRDNEVPQGEVAQDFYQNLDSCFSKTCDDIKFVELDTECDALLELKRINQLNDEDTDISEISQASDDDGSDVFKEDKQ